MGMTDQEIEARALQEHTSAGEDHAAWCPGPSTHVSGLRAKAASDGATVITGEDNIRLASYLALRGALKLEVKGLKRHGRSARTIANEHMGTNIKTARKTYEAFDKWLADNYGVERRPLA